MADIKYFDCHSHLNFPDFEKDREEVIAKMKEEGVATIAVGTNLKTSKEAVALAEKHENLFASVGLHPHEASLGFDGEAYRTLAGHPKVFAVGECGLDYYRLAEGAETEKKSQKEIFQKQMDLAVSLDKPLMIHCRGAYGEALEMLARNKTSAGERLRGVFHFFSDSAESAKGAAGLGFYVSFSGPVTFTEMYDEAVRAVPRKFLLCDTDAPFAAPAPWRGRRNEPVFIKEIAAALAEKRGEKTEETRAYMLENARQLFGF